MTTHTHKCQALLKEYNGLSAAGRITKSTELVRRSMGLMYDMAKRCDAVEAQLKELAAKAPAKAPDTKAPATKARRSRAKKACC